jgi:hypothetical protein
LLVAALPLLAACGQEAVTFTYEAPVGRKFVVEEALTQTTEVAPFAKFEIRIEGKSRVRVERESAWRTHWIETIDSGKMLAGEPTRQFDLGVALGGYEVRTDFTDGGEAVAVHGLGAVSSALLRTLQEAGMVDDPSAVSSVPSGAEHLALWNERTHALAGLRLQPDKPVEVTGQHDLGSDLSIGYRVKVGLGDGLPCPGDTERRCVNLALEYSAIEADVEALKGRRLDSLGAGSVVLDGIEVSGKGERVVDPSTLLVYSEKREPVLRLSGSAEGEQFKLTLRQHHRWTLRPEG